MSWLLIGILSFIIGGLWSDIIAGGRARQMGKELERRVSWRSP